MDLNSLLVDCLIKDYATARREAADHLRPGDTGLVMRVVARAAGGLAGLAIAVQRWAGGQAGRPVDVPSSPVLR